MNPDQQDLYGGLKTTTRAASAIKPRHNERVRACQQVGNDVGVILETWKGNETERGRRLVTLKWASSADGGVYDLDSEAWFGTPGELTSRRGIGRDI